MLEFDKFVARHGEVVAQAILENLERHEGVRSASVVPLQQRWHNLMRADDGFSDQRIAA